MIICDKATGDILTTPEMQLSHEIFHFNQNNMFSILKINWLNLHMNNNDKRWCGTIICPIETST